MAVAGCDLGPILWASVGLPASELKVGSATGHKPASGTAGGNHSHFGLKLPGLSLGLQTSLAYTLPAIWLRLGAGAPILA